MYIAKIYNKAEMIWLKSTRCAKNRSISSLGANRIYGMSLIKNVRTKKAILTFTHCEVGYDTTNTSKDVYFKSGENPPEISVFR